MKLPVFNNNRNKGCVWCLQRQSSKPSVDYLLITQKLPEAVKKMGYGHQVLLLQKLFSSSALPFAFAGKSQRKKLAGDLWRPVFKGLNGLERKCLKLVRLFDQFPEWNPLKDFEIFIAKRQAFADQAVKMQKLLRTLNDSLVRGSFAWVSCHRKRLNSLTLQIRISIYYGKMTAEKGLCIFAELDYGDVSSS